MKNASGLMVLFLLIFSALLVFATDTAFTDPTATHSGTCSSPDNAWASDDSRTTCGLGQTGHYDTFGFDIPIGATINGIRVRLEWKVTGFSTITTTAQLRDSTGLIGNTDSSSFQTNSTSDVTQTAGSTTDMWGTTLTVADINSADFGVGLVRTAPISGDPANWDDVDISVSYTENDGNFTASITTPSADANTTIDTNSLFLVEGSVTCDDANCGVVDANLQYCVGSGCTDFWDMNSDASAPLFLSSGNNPQSQHLGYNQSFTQSWVVESSFTAQSYELRVQASGTKANTGNSSGTDRTLTLSEPGSFKDPTATASSDGVDNPNNAWTSDDVNTTNRYVAIAGEATYDDFDFDVPVGAQINGIEVRVERHTQTGNTWQTDLQLVKAGTATGDTKSTASIASTTPIRETVGATNDLWGTTWTSADINHVDFGVYAVANPTSFPTGLRSFWDNIDINVSYTEKDGNLSFNITSPPSDANTTINVSEEFLVEGTVTCNDANCGVVDTTLQYCVGAGCTDFWDMNTVNTSPLYITSGANPQSTHLAYNQSYTPKWDVNSTTTAQAYELRFSGNGTKADANTSLGTDRTITTQAVASTVTIDVTNSPMTFTLNNGASDENGDSDTPFLITNTGNVDIDVSTCAQQLSWNGTSGGSDRNYFRFISDNNVASSCEGGFAQTGWTDFNIVGLGRNSGQICEQLDSTNDKINVGIAILVPDDEPDTTSLDVNVTFYIAEDTTAADDSAAAPCT